MTDGPQDPLPQAPSRAARAWTAATGWVSRSVDWLSDAVFKSLGGGQSLFSMIEAYVIDLVLGGQQLMTMRWRVGKPVPRWRWVRALMPWRKGVTIEHGRALLRVNRRKVVGRLLMVVLGALGVMLYPYLFVPLVIVIHASSYALRGVLDPYVVPWRPHVFWGAGMALLDVAVLLVALVAEWFLGGGHGYVFRAVAGAAFVALFVTVWLAWVVDFMFMAGNRILMRSQGLGLFHHVSLGGTTRETVAQRWVRAPGRYIGFDKTAGGDLGLQEYGPVDRRRGDDFQWFVLDPNQAYLDGGDAPPVTEKR